MKKSKFIFTGIIINERKGFSGLCLELDVATDGNTVHETKKNLIEAVSLYIETAVESNLPLLRPIPQDQNPMYQKPEDVIEKFPIKIDFKIRAYA